MEHEISSKLTGRFVDDDDLVRTGRAWVEIDGFDFLHIPVPTGFDKTMNVFEDQVKQVAEDVVSSGKYASAAKSSASAAAASAGKAADSEGHASSNAQKSQDGAQRAETAAGKAGESAASAAKSEQNASAQASSAEDSAGAAKDSATAAESSASKAAKSANDAAGSATSAKQDADRVANIADSTSWDGDKLTVNGQTSPSLTGPQGERGPAGPQGIQGPKGAVEPGEVVPLPRGEMIPDSDSGVQVGWYLQWNGGVAVLTVQSIKTSQSSPYGLVIGDEYLPEDIRPAQPVYGTVFADAGGTAHVNVMPTGMVTWVGLKPGVEYSGIIVWAIGSDVSAMSGPAGPAGPQGPPGEPGADGASTWEDVQDKPAAFPPEDHKHTSADITDAANYFGSPAFANRLVKTHPTGHLHDVNDPSEDNQLTRKAYVDKVAFPREVKSIKGAVDLDDYKETGLYHWDLDRDAKASNNNPNNRAGLLEVFNPKTGMTYQRYTDYGVQNNIWTRGLYNGKWSSWVKVSQDGHKHTMSDISDLPSVSKGASAHSIAQRNSDGTLYVSEPASSSHAANKSYVDTALGTAKAYTDALIVVGNTNAKDGKLHIVYE